MGYADVHLTPLHLTPAPNSLGLRIQLPTVIIPEYHCRPCGSRRMHPGLQTHCRSKKMPKPKWPQNSTQENGNGHPPGHTNLHATSRLHVHGRKARNPEHARRPEHARSEACTREQGMREEIHPLKILRRHEDTGHIIAGNIAWIPTLLRILYQVFNGMPTSTKMQGNREARRAKDSDRILTTRVQCSLRLSQRYYCPSCETKKIEIENWSHQTYMSRRSLTSCSLSRGLSHVSSFSLRLSAVFSAKAEVPSSRRRFFDGSSKVSAIFRL